MLIHIFRQSKSAVDGAAIARTFLALWVSRRQVRTAIISVKKSLLVLPFCFATFILSKQNKSRTAYVYECG
jgi:hypothetical protein